MMYTLKLRMSSQGQHQAVIVARMDWQPFSERDDMHVRDMPCTEVLLRFEPSR